MLVLYHYKLQIMDDSFINQTKQTLIGLRIRILSNLTQILPTHDYPSFRSQFTNTYPEAICNFANVSSLSSSLDLRTKEPTL